MQRRVPDTTKLKNLIHFKPTYTLTDIINDIAASLKQKSAQ